MLQFLPLCSMVFGTFFNYLLHISFLLLQLSRMYFFPLLCMGFSPCFDSCEAVMFSAAFFPPLLFMYWFGRKISVRAQSCGLATVRGSGRTLHLSFSFRSISSSLFVLSYTPFTTVGPQASNSSPWLQKLHSPAARLMCDPLLFPRWVMFHVLCGGSWEQYWKYFWMVLGPWVSSSFSFWQWTVLISLKPALFLKRGEGAHLLCKDNLILFDAFGSHRVHAACAGVSGVAFACTGASLKICWPGELQRFISKSGFKPALDALGASQ